MKKPETSKWSPPKGGPHYDPIDLLRPGRTITGMSAVYLPYDEWHRIDWVAFDGLLERTAEAGLTPVVNMDTGFATLITPTDREWILDRTKVVLGPGNFAAGAFHRVTPQKPYNSDGLLGQIAQVVEYGGLPVVFQNYGLTKLRKPQLVEAYQSFSTVTDQFIAFELGDDFAPFGAIYPLDVFTEIMAIPECIGLKHSSLSRHLEWQRLALRNEHRPDFKIFTGNDLAIDMVMYGSDYLLGLAAFAPDLFAERDQLWAAGDVGFYELNDALQTLGSFAFRQPVSAYQHSAAQFLHLRGWINTTNTHRRAPQRKPGDVKVLERYAARLGL